ncbi:class II glutamine amidotransferase [Streptomyces violaceorubidus]|uniref:class II glutamine amidotransferase n=1 Tax=Streptomyces violaceorubidus TaxID=284042 RepID=UPI0006912AE3|nr:class II glutamine amidotransferase [Streptomyces violaceorubidus]
MCRLLGVVSRTAAPLSSLLAEDIPPFLALACEHGDGWGIASLTTEGSVTSAKEPAAADRSERFLPTLCGTRTDAGLLHLRMASPGLPVRAENTHPFGDTVVGFAHNGDFTPATCLDDVIGEEGLARAEGQTDSERFYLATRRRIDTGMTPPRALLATAADIRARATGSASLNCLLLTPRGLYAYTAHDPRSDVIRRRGADFFALKYRRSADRVVIASTGWPQESPRWSTVPEGQVLEIRRHDLSTVLHADRTLQPGGRTAS